VSSWFWPAVSRSCAFCRAWGTGPVAPFPGKRQSPEYRNGYTAVSTIPRIRQEPEPESQNPSRHRSSRPLLFVHHTYGPCRTAQRSSSQRHAVFIRRRRVDEP
jgi:hypothetical protein